MAQKTKATSYGKTDVRYWENRIVKRVFESRGKQIEIPYWQIRISHLGTREWFNTGETNKSVAARKARDIWEHLRSHGWEATKEAYKPKAPPRETNTIEQFIELYRDSLKRVEYPPSYPTAERYIKDLKLICRNLHIKKLEKLTKESLEEFKGNYLESGRKAKRDPDSVKNSCNALLRNAAGMFSEQMRNEYSRQSLTIENPFEGQRLRRIQIKTYSPLRREMLNRLWSEASTLKDGNPNYVEPTSDPESKKSKSNRWKTPNFRLPQPGAYLLLLLELGLGLRRNEADKAQWDWFYTEPSGRDIIEIKQTPFFTPKSKSSRVIPVEKPLFDSIHKMRSDLSPFIVPGRQPKTYSDSDAPKNISYRCDQHHRTLAYWLRLQGINDQKPCHRLRKEFGSYVATAFGLYNAQKLLGHSSPDVTSQFYAGLTQLPELEHAKHL
jgi:integrase